MSNNNRHWRIELIVQILSNRVATRQEIDDILDWCHVRFAASTKFNSRLDRMVRRGMVIAIVVGKGRAHRYTTPDFLMGFAAADKDVAADFAEDHGDIEKAALLRAAQSVRSGGKLPP